MSVGGGAIVGGGNGRLVGRGRRVAEGGCVAAGGTAVAVGGTVVGSRIVSVAVANRPGVRVWAYTCHTPALAFDGSADVN